MSKFIGDVSAYAYAVSKGYTGTEEEFAELMASYASVAQSAAASATAAAGSATSAASSANTASTAASTATTKASEASTSATNASGSASSAASSASAASGSATSAAASATTASGKASEATTAATTATTAKTDAVAAKTAAETAKTAAETAQGLAEDAQAAAEEAAASVTASAAQIEQNAEDITAINEALTTKANADGSYDTLTAGSAKQLLSNLEQTDMVPYNYRTAGGSLEIGDREKLKKIVGGSLAVNQLVTDPNFTDGTKWDSIARAYATVSVSNNEITMTVVETVSANGIMNINSTVPNRAGHKLLFSAYVNPSKSVNVRIGASGSPAAGDYGLDSSPVAASTWTLMEKIGSCQSGNTASSLNLYLDVGSALTEGDTVKVKNFVCFDLTAMFGSTIADYIYALEQATAGAGVAWLKARFPKVFDAGYIPYNAGTLEHVSGLSAHKMVGFNQWDEEWEVGCLSSGVPSFASNAIRSKNYCPCIGGATYYMTCGKTDGGVNNRYYIAIAFYDADKKYIKAVYYNNGTAVAPDNARYFKITTNTSTVIYGSTYNHDICINLHWDGERDGEYEAYEEHSYPLDSDVTLRGIYKLDANNQLYADGDEYEADGTVTRRYGIVDLGTLTWTQDSVDSTILYTGPTYLVPKAKFNGNLFCKLYDGLNSGTWRSLANMQMVVDNSVDIPILRIKNNSFSEQTSSDFKAAMSGVYLVYELATPTTEEADPYTEIQNVSNWGTEEFVSECLVPVGHETEYQPDLRAKIEVAPESPDTDGLYLMKRENGQNSYVAYLGELPSDPSEDGTYTLKCTVASGTATKTWEADE